MRTLYMGEPAASPLPDSHIPGIFVFCRFPTERFELHTVLYDGLGLWFLLVLLAPLMLGGLASLVYYFYSRITATANAGSLMTTVEMMPLSQDLDLLLSDQDDEDIESEGEVCAICFYRLRAEEPKYSLPCHHDYFHMRCIKKWMTIRTVCPVCRQDCSQEDVIS